MSICLHQSGALQLTHKQIDMIRYGFLECTYHPPNIVTKLYGQSLHWDTSLLKRANLFIWCGCWVFPFCSHHWPSAASAAHLMVGHVGRFQLHFGDKWHLAVHWCIAGSILQLKQSILALGSITLDCSQQNHLVEVTYSLSIKRIRSLHHPYLSMLVYFPVAKLPMA